jgi:hypothetical protein
MSQWISTALSASMLLFLYIYAASTDETSAVSFASALPLILLSLVLAVGIDPLCNVLWTGTIAFFPGTAWSFHRRRRRMGPAGPIGKRAFCELLTRIEPVKTKTGENTEFDTSLRIRTDLDVWTIKRRRFDNRSTDRCREILGRLVGNCATFPDPSSAVVAQSKAENIFLGLPRPSYRALSTRFELIAPTLVSVTYDQLIVRREWSSLLPLLFLISFPVVDAGAVCVAALMAPNNPWLPATAGAMVFLRAVELANGLLGKTLRLCRTKQSVVVGGYGRGRCFPSSICEAECRYYDSEGSTTWNVRLQIRTGIGSRRKPKQLATWNSDPIADYAEWRDCEAGRAAWRPEHDTMDERGARNIQAALRYYLNQSSLDEIASLAKEGPRP